MNCRSAEPLFSAFLEDDLSQTERRDLEAHLLSCRRCSLSVRELRSTLELLAQAPTFETSPNFEADLMARIRSGEGLRPTVIEWIRGYLEPARLRPLFLAGAGACAVWIAVILAGPNGMLRTTGATRIAGGMEGSKATLEVPSAPAGKDAALSTGGALVPSAEHRDQLAATQPSRTQAAPSRKAAVSGYAVADQEWHGLRAGQDSVIPNPDSRYEDEYVTDQFILERGFEGSNNRTITPVSDRPSDDVFITF